MKPAFYRPAGCAIRSSRYYVRLAAYAILMLTTGLLGPALAATYYWDTNGATLGTGTNPNGVWDIGSSFWNFDRDGSVSAPTVTTSALDDLIFSAGSDATGAYTVTVSGTQEAKSLTFEDGTATLSG